MNAFKQKCIELRKQDYTLPEIMKMTGRSKTSVYFHIKDIPLSRAKQEQVSNNSRNQARRIAKERKGVALRPYKPFTKWSKERVLLVGHLMFDGEILKKRCIYNNRSRSLINRVQQLMAEIYEHQPRIYVHSVSGVTRLQYFNVELQSSLHDKAHELLSAITSMPISHQREFLRAFFDDEGCMDYKISENKRRIRGYQNNREILYLIRSLLKNFGIESKVQGKNEVVITGKENLKRFQKEINFSKGVRLNPNRANSVWKKPIEKREILKQAIRSFKTK